MNQNPYPILKLNQIQFSADQVREPLAIHEIPNQMQHVTNERAIDKQIAKAVTGRPVSQGFIDEREENGKGSALDFTFNMT